MAVYTVSVAPHDGAPSWTSGRFGNTDKTMSWTNPTIPSTAIITATKLSGYVRRSDSDLKSATLGGVTLPLGDSSPGNFFTIDLGTTLVSSLTLNMKTTTLKQSTIYFSSLLYEITYAEDIKYTVTYVDASGATIKTETVLEGAVSTPPDDLYVQGKIFIGWSHTGPINSNMTITPVFRDAELYTINFYDWDGTLIESKKVYEMDPITPPASPNTKFGYRFIAWNEDLDKALYNSNVYAVYDKVNFTTHSMVLRPTSYVNGPDGQKGFDQNYDQAYDGDPNTAARGSIKKGSAAFINYYWTPESINLDRYRIQNVSYCLKACCKNSTATGQVVLASTMVSSNRRMADDWLWHYCDWKTYEHPITYEEYLASAQGVEIQGYSDHDLGSLGNGYAYVFDIYFQIDYADAGQEIILSHIEETIHQEQMLSVTAYFYPFNEVLEWEIKDNSDIVRIYPSADGRKCDIVADKTGECFVIVKSKSNPSITNSIYIVINEADVERRTTFKLGHSTLTSSNLRFGNSFVPKVYLGDKVLMENIYTVPYEKFLYNFMKDSVVLPLYSQLEVDGGYARGLVCRNGNYIGLGLLDGGHQAGGIKNVSDDGGVDVGDATTRTYTTKDIIPVTPGEKIIANYPSTTYSFGLVGYDQNGNYKYTYFGDSVGWKNYDYQDDADIEGPQLNITIPNDVYYIRWCYYAQDWVTVFDIANNPQNMDKVCILRRYTEKVIDLEAWPPNATETATLTAVSSNTSVAVIDHGMIRAKAPGSCTVTITQGTLSATINVVVYDNIDDFVFVGSY